MTTPHAERPAPSLTRLDVEGAPRALVLMLHGGKPTSQQVVDGRSASWRRVAALQRAVTPALHEAGASTWLLRYRARGWNLDGAGAIADARWALARARAELADTPVVLLGHSMGARTAVHVADDDRVAGVVALAPWLPPDEPVRALTGRHLLAAHGRSDKITSARQTAAYVERAARVAASARLVDMGRVGHYMFRRVEDWNRVATEGVLDLLQHRTEHRPERRPEHRTEHRRPD
ncbi:alpha/beta hydrolase [Nocardioides kribbensis]|uniref:alpha/beta hydrolase n=1 Tax=Nocardioides kribbensis TaxID=305517 RepID=UPI0032DA2ADC